MSRAKKFVREEVEAPELSDDAGEVSSTLAVQAGARRRRHEGRPTKDRSKIVRATYESTRDLEFRLLQVARFKNMRKYDLIYKLLDEGCAGCAIDEFLKECIVKIQGKKASAA